MPSIDVLVSTLNEEQHIERCVHSILDQDYPSEKVDVTVVDGGSTDDTIPLLRSLEDPVPRLHVVADGRRRNLPEALNHGLALTSGELVAKIDAHGYPEHDYLSAAVDALGARPPHVACVGGRIEQEGETRFGRAVASARTSRFGVGGSRYASRGGAGFVETVQCGIYRRDALDHVGSFDALMAFGEDEELNWRLKVAGYEILFDPRIRYHYVARGTWSEAFSQYRNYGAARVRVARKHPAYLRPYHAVPAATVLTGAALLALSPFRASARRALGWGAASYVGAATVAGRQASPREGTAQTARVVAAFAALHAGYGLGMLGELQSGVPDGGATGSL